jgi:hypothetical protein
VRLANPGSVVLVLVGVVRSTLNVSPVPGRPRLPELALESMNPPIVAVARLSGRSASW